MFEPTNLNFWTLIGSSWSWQYFCIKTHCPFQRPCRRSTLSWPGKFCFSLQCKAALCVTCAMRFPWLETGLKILRSVPGVTCSLRSPSLLIFLGSTWTVERSVCAHPDMTVSWFLFWLSFLFCADFFPGSVPFLYMTSSLIYFPLKPEFATVFTCSQAIHPLIGAFTDVITILLWI